MVPFDVDEAYSRIKGVAIPRVVKKHIRVDISTS